MEATFGKYIRKLRNSKDLTLTELAVELNLDVANLSRIENDKRKFDEKKLIKLAQIFDIDVSEIKTEYYSNLFAQKLYENNCSNNVLTLAEEKVKYLRNKNLK